jgi:hypothetical protein
MGVEILTCLRAQEKGKIRGGDLLIKGETIGALYSPGAPNPQGQGLRTLKCLEGKEPGGPEEALPMRLCPAKRPRVAA